MRILFLILTIFAFTSAAQTSSVNQSFEAATRTAQAKQFERAIEKYRTTLLRAENEFLSDDFLARIHFNIGVCYYQLKNSAKAVEEFGDAIKSSKRTYQKAFYALGMAHRDLKNWRKAAAAFRQAVELKPDDGEAWFDLAMVSLEEKDFDAAQNAFGKAIKFESIASAAAHNNIGVILALQHNFSLAENEFEAALTESNGKSVEAKNNLQFCRFYKRNSNRDWLAQLSFSRKDT